MKTRQLARLREDTERDVEIANAGLDLHRREVRALTDKLIEQRALLYDREASAAEASAKLQRVLVAVLDGALKNMGERLGEAAQREVAIREEVDAAMTKLAGKEEEVMELRAEVAVAKKCTAYLERSLLSRLRDQNIGMSHLRDAIYRAADTMQQADLLPAEQTEDYLHDRLEDHARFLNSLSGQLAGLRESFEDTLSQEGKQVTVALATHILSRLHHHDPAFPMEALFERITPPAKKEEAEAAVAAHIAELVSRMARK